MSPKNLGLIVTADDLGLSDPINQGIVEAHRTGIVTSASLLMNAPKTAQAIQIARQTPSLEVGLHLSLVEGFSLAGVESSVTDTLRYLDGPKLCLHRHWKFFMRRYLTGRIKLADLEKEFRLQIEGFRSAMGEVPFLNGTQHLHTLPGIQELVLSLMQEYKIPAIRCPHRMIATTSKLGRAPMSLVLKALGRRMRRRCDQASIKYPTAFAGFDSSGSMSAEKILGVLKKIQTGTLEIMVHPGFDSPHLRASLPWGYATFDWQGELAAVTDARVRAAVAQGCQLITFGAIRG
jgi:predicted glycoside hydrolase/deacetylase ChbG (UPF0249 family)